MSCHDKNAYAIVETKMIRISKYTPWLLGAVAIVLLSGALLVALYYFKLSNEPSTPVALDQDKDGLPDTFEAFYHTNPARADTDGDGTGDLQELALGRDPSIKSPHDEVKPLTGDSRAEVSTYTQRYLATLPPDVAREQILAPERLDAFLALQHDTSLPAIPPPLAESVVKENNQAIALYLQRVSVAHNTELALVSSDTITAGLSTLLSGNSSDLEHQVNFLEKNIVVLKKIVAPPALVPLHETLIQATQMLQANLQLLGGIRGDLIGGLVASKRIEELGPVFAGITEQFEELQRLSR